MVDPQVSFIRLILSMKVGIVEVDEAGKNHSLMRLMSRNCSLFLVLLLCVDLSHGASTNPLKLKLSKDIKRNDTLGRKLAKSKGSKTEYSSEAWDPAMDPENDYAASHNEREPTDKPIDEPTDKPTDGPTEEPTISPSSDVLESGNIFDVSEGKQDPNASSDGLEGSFATVGTAQHIVAHVSVAFSRSASPSEFKNNVAKIMTNVIRSYTPFVVYMLDGSRARRQLSTAYLEYDPKFSKVELAYSGAQVSWWTYDVAYKVTKLPEEQEEASRVNDLAQSAAEGSILSGLFLKLLASIAPDVRGVSLPGHELDQDLEPPTNVSGAQPSETQSRKRSEGIGLGFLCVSVILVIILTFFVAHRRKRRQAQEAWAISIGAQKCRGEILNAEWTSAYDYHEEEDAPMLAIKGSFTLAPRDPPGVYAFGSWEHGTVSGTEDVSARDGSLSIGNGSFT